MHEISGRVPQESNDAENKKLRTTARYDQAFKSVMNSLGATPFSWLRQKLERYRSAKEADRILEKLLPIRLKEIGMRGIVQIPSETGRYIVHVGQVHSSSDVNTDYLSPEISVSQRSIERLITEGKIPEVFHEGTFEDSEKIDADLEKIRNMELTRNFVRLLPQILKKVAEFQGNRFFSIYKYAFRRKLEAFLQKCEQEGWKEEQRKAQEALRTLSFEDVIVDPYKEVGGARIAQANGKVKVHATEDSDAHARATALTNQMKRLRNEIFEEFVQDPHSPKIPVLREMFEKAEEDFRVFDHSERENIAIQKIVRHPSFANNKVAYLVYGSAHDFSAAVNGYNKQNPNEQIGLIYVTDIDTFNEK